ncbi:MAG: NfeD family protein [bacterium]|nr:NfeD family protein [bacterium]
MSSLVNPVLVWFLLGALLAVLEFCVPGIVLIFFAVSAWAVAALLALGVRMSLAVQILIWIVLGVVLLFSLRRWLSGQLTGFTLQKGDLDTIPHEAVGAHVEVVEEIGGKEREGRVRWRGTLWRASADESIPAGTMVEVVRQDNLVLHVRRIG